MYAFSIRHGVYYHLHYKQITWTVHKAKRQAPHSLGRIITQSVLIKDQLIVLARIKYTCYNIIERRGTRYRQER